MQFIEVKNWDFNELLTEHFSIGEMVRSDLAYRNRLRVQYMEQPDVLEAMRFLCTSLLEPVRADLNMPVIVSSGYRCRALNQLAGGANNSLHMVGYAADIKVPGNMLKLVRAIRNNRFHECIVHSTYVHVSMKPSWNELRYRNQSGLKEFDF